MNVRKLSTLLSKPLQFLEPPTSGIASSVMESYGSYSEAVVWWQRTKYASMEYRAEIVRNLLALQGMRFFSHDKNVSVLSALHERFQKLSDSATLLALTPASGDLMGIRSIMTLLREYVAQHILPQTSSIGKTIALEFLRSHAMKLKLSENSILDRCTTVFDWKVKQDNPLQGWKNPPYKVGKFLQAWECRPLTSEKGKTSLQEPDLFIIRYDSSDVPLEYVIKRNNRYLYKRGPSISMEHAAEKTYQYWHEMVTTEKCKAALQPTPGRTIVLFGQWVDDQIIIDDPAKYKGRIYPGNDEKENLTFVHGSGPDKIEGKVAKILKPRASTSIEQELLLESGFIVKTSLDWRVKHPQQYIEGDAMCQKCECIDTVAHGDYRYIHGFGLTCGVCMDHLLGDICIVTADMLD